MSGRDFETDACAVRGLAPLIMEPQRRNEFSRLCESEKLKGGAGAGATHRQALPRWVPLCLVEGKELLFLFRVLAAACLDKRQTDRQTNQTG